jgi:hypothetical protein
MRNQYSFAEIIGNQCDHTAWFSQNRYVGALNRQATSNGNQNRPGRKDYNDGCPETGKTAR